jgi:hypothetical protein
MLRRAIKGILALAIVVSASFAATAEETKASCKPVCQKESQQLSADDRARLKVCVANNLCPNPLLLPFNDVGGNINLNKPH